MPPEGEHHIQDAEVSLGLEELAVAGQAELVVAIGHRPGGGDRQEDRKTTKPVTVHTWSLQVAESF